MTITIPEDVLRWARVEAAKRETSVSKLLGELLRQRMATEDRYESAMKAYLDRRPRALRRRGEVYPKREELHER